ncbi:hypothetical protein F5878DRAFT_519372, partial [Lentinula raphanica]
MRNQGEDKQDIQFRKALENMRYKACTKDDIKCLNALVSANKPNRHYIACEPWRSAPIIIGENKQRDEINRLGAMRFAMDTKQKLTAFYSEDTICSAAGTKTDSKPTNRTKKSKVNTMNQDLQNILWDLPASTHEFHSPSMLPLCKGMPVIIRHNFATEMNITKGQRGFVFSWQSKKSTADKDHIEVLFVLLHNPPSPVQIEGLPLNVVPIVSRESKGYITLPDDTKIYVSRKQVDVLLGFAMTAYASQGQSLSPNATDLNTLNDHHAFYTALSRSRSYEKTIILQGFNHTCITGGASGALRKEFRDLELLDEITRLQYEGKCDPSVKGTTRSILIELFRKWKGDKFNPPSVHAAIKWSAKDPYVFSEEIYNPWKIVAPLKKQYTVENEFNLIPFTPPSKSSVVSNSLINPIVNPSPLSASLLNNRNASINVRQNTNAVTTLKWSNNSCAYDALFLILRQVWIETTFDITTYTNLPAIMNGFRLHSLGQITLEEVRDDFRRLVH